jgi:hypothetical protein
MRRLARLLILLTLVVGVGNAISPCAAPPVVHAQENCYFPGGVDCGPPECQQLSVCQPGSGCIETSPGNYDCPALGPPYESEPSCCGSGVDCICPGYEYLHDWDRVCDGYSACCCHDTCCRTEGPWGCFTYCWVVCVGGCGAL